MVRAMYSSLPPHLRSLRVKGGVDKKMGKKRIMVGQREGRTKKNLTSITLVQREQITNAA